MLDLRGLHVAMTISLFIASFAVYWLYASRLSHKGALWWGHGAFSVAVGILLISLRDTISPFFSIVIANGLIATGYAATWYAAALLTKTPFSRRHQYHFAILVSLALGICFWFTYVTPHLGARIIFMSAISATLNALTAKTLLPYGKQVKAARIIGTVYIANALVFSTRILLTVTVPPTAPFLHTGSVTAAFMLWGMGFVYLSSFGVIMMMVEELNQKLTRQAIEDPLTGLPNRRALHTTVPHDFARLERSGEHLAILALDLDHFKQINDSYGHITGDALLQYFTGLVTNCLRKNDKFFRYGGEEFLIVAPQTSLEQATSLAEHIRSQVEQYAFARNDKTVPCTVSIGIAVAHGSQNSLEVTLDQADHALHSAKTLGRNRVERYQA